MTHREQELARAEQQATDARRALTETLVDIQRRLNPRTLARDAVEEIRDTAIDIARSALDAAKRNPGPLLGIGAALSFAIGQRWFGQTAAPVMPEPDVHHHADETPPPDQPQPGITND